MSVITHAAALEAMGRTIADMHEEQGCKEMYPCSDICGCRDDARAALAALARLGGDKLGECSRDPHCPRVAALLRVLAEAAHAG